MAVAGNGEGVGEGVALFDEDLVANAAAGGVEVDGMLAGESLYGGVLGEVLGGLVLDVVVESEYKLFRIVDACGSYGLEPLGRKKGSASEFYSTQDLCSMDEVNEWRLCRPANRHEGIAGTGDGDIKQGLTWR